DACLDRIGPSADHNDGNRLGRILDRPDVRIPSCYHDDIDLEMHQLGRKRREPIELPLRISVLDAMFCPSMWPRSRSASRITSARVDSLAASRDDRYPIRGTFPGCCASVTTATVSSITATRIGTAVFFICTSFVSVFSTNTET